MFLRSLAYVGGPSVGDRRGQRSGLSAAANFEREREREREVRRGWAFVQIMEGSCRYSALANKSWRSGLCSQ